MSVTEDEDYNLLRPETIESLMLLYRATGDKIYREYGRRIMYAIERNSKVRSCYGPQTTCNSNSPYLCCLTACMVATDGRIPQSAMRVQRP
jgi:hypothetical protein